MPQREPIRSYKLFVPQLPERVADPGRVVRELEVTAPAWMFVPKVLQRTGFGGYEAASLPHFLAALEEAPPGAVLDIGANIGPYALLARSLSDRVVVGFEPTPDLAVAARAIADRNGLAYLVEALALGDSVGRAALHLSTVTDSSNSLNQAFRPCSGTINVPLETLDSYVARTGVVPAVLKVDTETTEPAVLRGARQSIGVCRPWIFCEVLSGWGEEDLARVVAPWRYTWYHLTGPGPLEPQNRIVGDAAYSNLMWLFAPEPLDAAHWERAARWRRALDACSAPS